LVTGASSVLGRALLRRLWAEPAWAGFVFYLAGRDQAALDSLCLEAAAAAREAKALPLDMAGPSSVQSCARGLAHAAPLKGFVFAAGMAQDRVLPLLAESAFDRVLQVNLGFHAGLLKLFREPGRLAPGARGLLIGSSSGLRGQKGQSAYAAAKGGLVDLLALAPKGLRLNVLLPPLTPSPFLESLSPAARAELYSARLLDDPDPAASCAEAALFLLSDGASYIHRQVISADSRVGALGWD
jgi:3-oxoacyl-[acyl-carrier protein] reductase